MDLTLHASNGHLTHLYGWYGEISLLVVFGEFSELKL